MKAKFSTITATIATIAAIATIGSIGGAGQQIALAQEVDFIDEVKGVIAEEIEEALATVEDEIPEVIISPGGLVEFICSQPGVRCPSDG